MPQTLEARIAAIQARASELKKVEDEYETVREIVSNLWKQYFPAAERKKMLQEKRKLLKAQMQKAIESDIELKALLSSIK